MSTPPLRYATAGRTQQEPRSAQVASRPRPTGANGATRYDVVVTLGIMALLVLALNVPFGFWRAGTKRFTLPWFLAIHLPVPMAVGLRLAAGVGWRLATLPLFVGAFFAGQFLGGKCRR